MSVRRSSLRSPSRSVERYKGLKQMMFWGGLIVGSFLVGALVISPLYSALAGERPQTLPRTQTAAVGQPPAASTAPTPVQQHISPPPPPASPPVAGTGRDTGSPEIRIGSPGQDDVQTPANPDQAGGVNSPDSGNTSRDNGADTGDRSSASGDTGSARDSVSSGDTDTTTAEPRRERPRRSSRRTRHSRHSADTPPDARPARDTGDTGVQQPDSPDGR